MTEKPHIEFRNVTARYGKNIALDGLDFAIRKNTIFGIVGPANSGKTTLLKCINRTIDFIPSASGEGSVRVSDTNAEGDRIQEDVREIRNVYSLRRRIGMVFPLPVGLPMSIYENVAYGPRRAGILQRKRLACGDPGDVGLQPGCWFAHERLRISISPRKLRSSAWPCSDSMLSG